MVWYRNPKIVVSIVFVMSMFMAIMDVTIVNVALPTLGREFHVAPTGVDAVVTSFLVSLAIVIPASGWLGDRFGTKRVLLIAITIFTLSSALCGQAHSLTELVIFRILQGIGGGMLTPVGMAMLYRTFPPQERVRASRILTIPTAFAPAIGPVLGGLLVTQLSWRWVFYVNVPIGFAAFAFGALFLEENREPTPGRFDVPGFVLAGVGFSALMYSVSEGPVRGWATWPIAGTGILGVFLIAALIVIELRVPLPMLDFRLMKDRLFAVSNIVLFFSALAFLGSLYLVALFYQDGLGLSALGSGLSTFPEAIGIMAGAQIVARIYPRIGPRRTMAYGELGVAIVLALTLFANFHTSLWYMRILMFFLGITQAHVFVPAQAAGFATISKASTGRASGMFNSIRQLGGATGVAVLTTVLAAVGARHVVGGVLRPNLLGFHLAFLSAAGLAVIGAIAALFIHDKDAAATMKPKRKHPVSDSERSDLPVESATT